MKFYIIESNDRYGFDGPEEVYWTVVSEDKVRNIQLNQGDKLFEVDKADFREVTLEVNVTVKAA